MKAQKRHIQLIEKMIELYPFDTLMSRIEGVNYCKNGLLESAICSGIHSYYYAKNKNLLHIIMLIGYRISENHSFNDANHRIALTFIISLLDLLDIEKVSSSECKKIENILNQIINSNPGDNFFIDDDKIIKFLEDILKYTNHVEICGDLSRIVIEENENFLQRKADQYIIRADIAHIMFIENVIIARYPFKQVNSDIINQDYGCLGDVDYQKLESAIYSGINEYHYAGSKDLVRIISLIAFKMAKNHCFTDGNKRTSLTFMMFLFELFEVNICIDEEKLADIFEKMVEKSDINILYSALSESCQTKEA